MKVSPLSTLLVTLVSSAFIAGCKHTDIVDAVTPHLAPAPHPTPIAPPTQASSPPATTMPAPSLSGIVPREVGEQLAPLLSNTAPERTLEEAQQTDRTIFSIAGGIGGAAAAYLAADALNLNDHWNTRKSVIAAGGAVVGVGLGYVLGDAIADRRKRYASEHDAVLDDLAFTRDQLRQMNERYSQLHKELADLEAKRSELATQTMTAQLRADLVRADLDSLTGIRTRLENEKQLSLAKTEDLAKSIDILEKNTPSNITLQDKEQYLSELRNQREAVASHTQQLLAMSSSLDALEQQYEQLTPATGG